MPTSSPTPIRPVVLVILDGFGLSALADGNAYALAKHPNFDAIQREYPGAALGASGISVGLSWGEPGNSEVGHRTLGGGVVLYQNLPRITLAIEDGSFFTRPAFTAVAAHVRKNKSTLHVMGLLGNGGIHAHTEHMLALVKFAAQQKLPLKLHLFTDGIDAPPRSSLEFLDEVDAALKQYGGEVATVCGRDYSMDRDNRWERTAATYDLLVHGKGEQVESARAAIEAAHAKGLTDEKVLPSVVVRDGVPVGQVAPGDGLVYTNFRNDRERQLTEAFALPSVTAFKRGPRLDDLFFVTMVQYEEALPVEVAFPPEHVEHPLARVLSEAGRKQFHVAETEKYAHVTFFFNGGVEKAFAGEDRVLVPTKKVASFDLAPEMSAAGVTAAIVKALGTQQYDFFVANYANSDMVGHTGVLTAAVKAIEVLDHEVGAVRDAVLAAGGAMLITSDHGNSEEMLNPTSGDVDKQHSTNAVPFYLIAAPYKLAKPKSDEEVLQYYNPPAGVLADVAPTVLELLGLPKHPDMTGVSLLNIIT
ncbi:MAG: 2,3-bisphosphoglycerate-independent phosphoglycerate mutase [Candidatus Andersenbacteria bacterium]